MAVWSIDPSSSLASIDDTGKLTYSEHSTDTEYTINYADGTCAASKRITIKACSPGHWVKKVHFVFAMANELINTFIVQCRIKKKSDGTQIYTTDVGNTDKRFECSEQQTSFSKDVDFDVECPGGIENYYFELFVKQCHGWNPQDCSSQSHLSHDFYVLTTKLDDKTWKVDDISTIPNEVAVRSELKTP